MKTSPNQSVEEVVEEGCKKFRPFLNVNDWGKSSAEMDFEEWLTQKLAAQQEAFDSRVRNHLDDLQAILDEKDVTDKWRLEEVRAIISLSKGDIAKRLLNKPEGE